MRRAKLLRRTPPSDLDPGLVLREAALHPTPTWTFPTCLLAGRQSTRHWDDPDWTAARTSLLERDPEPWHQAGGHPDQIQGEMRVACALASGGIYIGSPPPPSPEADRLVTTAPSWRLLFQCASDDTIDLMWGDAGKLYVWMREEDLAEHRWERAWIQLQCS